MIKNDYKPARKRLYVHLFIELFIFVVVVLELKSFFSLSVCKKDWDLIVQRVNFAVFDIFVLSRRI